MRPVSASLRALSAARAAHRASASWFVRTSLQPLSEPQRCCLCRHLGVFAECSALHKFALPITIQRIRLFCMHGPSVSCHGLKILDHSRYTIRMDGIRMLIRWRITYMSFDLELATVKK